MSWGFERGRVYNRRADIHARFGGQQQGGMITPARFPLIIIVTGAEGQQHGYNDRWEDGAFYYFGHGQRGAMQLARANRALANHSADGKAVLLFQTVAGGLRFVDEMVCEGYQIEQHADGAGEVRDAIVFKLVPIDSINEEIGGAPDQAAQIADLRQRAMNAATVPAAVQGVRTVYQRSRDVRDYVLRRAGTHCEGCEAHAPFARRDGSPYLEPHHTRRLSDGGPDDPRYVIALCPTCHRRVHHGIDGEDYNVELINRLGQIEAA
ncbi:MAG: HNH endonuclease [Mesorhizobium sp.]|uniref:HNH endonuclease n=1 Tax=Mesorhizobium sp. TaxID=1871066 RepID=UPI000FE51AE3|nr:HNH endonuclease signature motif containing protein [Mesorhizobium sp.]RWM19649.1 MAG: HNH endonuclease [Mesorhizobium sp.]